MASPAGNDIQIGTVLDGTYRIDGLIGRGGMGAVYSASHARLPGKRVAVKVLLAQVETGGESYQRFRREAEIASRIGHPNIVQVLDWNTLPSGAPYLVLELLAGESLAKRLTRGPISVETTLDITRQVGSALSAAHRAGVVHRDLKPDNIFLCPTEIGGEIVEQVKVLDFGISKMRHSTTIQTQEAQILGTPQYMSPEQASGKNSQIDERTDVFALGAIAYEMLTGKPAFSGDNLAQVVFKVVYENPEPLPASVPPAVAAAVTRALAKDPAARFPDVAGFVAAMTGRALQTLDRPGKIVPAAAGDAFAKTGAASADDAFASTVAPGSIDAPAVAAKSLTPGQMAGQIATEPPRPNVAVAAPTAAPSSGGGGKRWLWGGAVVVAAAAGALVVVQLLGGGKDKPSSNAAAGPTTSASANPVAPPIATPIDAGAVAAVAAANAGEQPKGDEGEPPKGDDKPKPKADESEPPKGDDKPKPKGDDKPKPKGDEESDGAEPDTVKADLDAAKSQIDAKNYKQALFLANKTLKIRPTPRAHYLIALAYCGQHDLGMVNASLHSVRRADRSRLKKKCAELGMEID